MSVPARGKHEANGTDDLFSVSGRNDVQSKGSDIEYDFMCDPCEEDGRRFEANGFCSDCNHYLCETCYTAHRRPIPMRNHKLLDKNDMPKIRPKSTSKDTEVIEEKCDVHVGKFVEFFCGNHDIIGCSVCMMLEHKSCDSVQFVPDMKIDKDELDGIIIQLAALSSNAKAAKDHAKKRIVQTKDSFDNVLQEGKQFCKKSKDFIERLEKNFEESAQVERDNIIEEVESTMDSLVETVKHAESLSEKLIGFRSLKKEANLFISVKKAEKYIGCSSLEDILGISEERNTGYIFMPNKDLIALQENIESLGIAMPIFGQLRADPPASEKMTLLFADEFSIRAKDDTSDCCIVGISNVFGHDRIIVADAVNNKIKVIKNSKTTTTSLKLPAKPHAMAKFGYSKVCVTIPEKRKILVINVSKLLIKDTIKIVKSLDCDGKCYGIASDDETIVATCEYESGCFKINFMNISGHVFNQVLCLDNEPMYIAVHNDCLYTLDTKRALLKCLSRLDSSTKSELKIENVTHFTVTENFLIVVVDLPQGLRIFDHDFHEIDFEGSGVEDEVNPVIVNYEFGGLCFVGYKDGRVQKSLLLSRQSLDKLLGMVHRERNIDNVFESS